MKRHILICGDMGVGKSTLIKKLLTACRRPVYGFITEKKQIGEDGQSRVYIHAANDDSWHYNADNQVGTCHASGCVGIPEAFDTTGVTLLQAPPEGLVLMDELGFLESQASRFCTRVLQMLDHDTPVLAAVKSRDTSFINAVMVHDNAQVYHVTPENRDALYFDILPAVMDWNH